MIPMQKFQQLRETMSAKSKPSLTAEIYLDHLEKVRQWQWGQAFHPTRLESRALELSNLLARGLGHRELVALRDHPQTLMASVDRWEQDFLVNGR